MALVKTAAELSADADSAGGLFLAYSLMAASFGTCNKKRKDIIYEQKH